MIEFVLVLPIKKKVGAIDELFVKTPVFSLRFQDDWSEFAAWGDPIAGAVCAMELGQDAGPQAILSLIKGHFYYVHLNKREGRLWIGSSFFSVLPIYYRLAPDSIVMAENALTLGKYAGINVLSRRFVLETALFHYPISDVAPIEGVKLLPANSAFTVARGGWRIEKHTRIEDAFPVSPAPWRKAVPDLSELFLQTTAAYLPDCPYMTSLSGGFDGRTLVAAGLRWEKEFSCYCFGSQGSQDIPIASILSADAGLPFLRIDLNEGYVRLKSLECGLEFIRNASGTATFARAHYLHAAKLLASAAEHIVTGNFGSEILRAAHVTGAVISPNLHQVFDSNSPEEAWQRIATSSESGYLNMASFREECQALRADLASLPCFERNYGCLTRNQRFYVFVFEEVFRKYFGAEMVNQFRYLKNRTPFLDMDFLRALFKTSLAGIHSDYFEHNPLKRQKGQILYAHLIRKAYPAFGRRLTDKGYAPDDLLSIGGKMRIAVHYAKKSMGQTTKPDDPFAVQRSFASNREHFKTLAVDPGLFHAERIRSELDCSPREQLFIPLSLSYLQAGIEE